MYLNTAQLSVQKCFIYTSYYVYSTNIGVSGTNSKLLTIRKQNSSLLNN